jgi:hypothetical protein
VIRTRTKAWLGNTEAACGEAECAATQTVHFAASFALEWWCVTVATAVHKVSSRHSNAIRFENDRISVLKIYTDDKGKRNQLSVP